MSLTSFHLVVPVYNEAAVIVPTLRELERVLSGVPKLRYEIIVADNGSTDGTAEVVNSAGFNNVRVILVPGRGKGRAIIHASQSFDSDVFGFCDADLSADPSSLPDMLLHIENGAHVVVGSRLLNERLVKRAFWRTFSSKIFNIARRLILGIRVADSQCGLKLFKGTHIHLIRDSVETGWFLDMEILARAERENLTIVEVPVSWTEYRYADRKSKLKVLRDGFGALIAMVRIRRRLI